MNKYYFILFLILINAIDGESNELKITPPILYTDNDKTFAVMNVSWENAWHNSKNHDGVWLFFKFIDEANGFRHVKVSETGHHQIQSQSDVRIGFQVPEDHVGLFIFPTNVYSGNIHISVSISIDKESFKDISTRVANFVAYGIEMVYIPAGGFTLGDPDSTAIQFGSLYASDNEGNRKGLYQITDEKQSIKIASEDGALFYQAPEGFEGDQTGIIPEDFPKGVDPFYIMKYEPTQKQYADFLNSLSEDQSQNRVNFGGKNYSKNYGSIFKEDNYYSARNPNAPCNYMSWDDAMAYADWAGLRPMTEFEFTKASRGPVKPAKGEFPWGSSNKLKIQRLVSKVGAFEMINGWDESKLNEDTKDIFGASFYWVMDLAGGLWERVITIGHPYGRTFTGQHGDGFLTNDGFADVTNWPSVIQDTGGFGYRGGGFYGYGRDYHEFNPYSPIGYRPYGAWSGGNRSKAYGARFVRTFK